MFYQASHAVHSPTVQEAASQLSCPLAARRIRSSKNPEHLDLAKGVRRRGVLQPATWLRQATSDQQRGQRSIVPRLRWAKEGTTDGEVGREQGGGQRG